MQQIGGVGQLSLSTIASAKVVCPTSICKLRMSDIPQDNQVRVLRELYRLPELFAEIANSRETELQMQSRLRESYSAEAVRGAIILHELRQRASAKFERAEDMWFDRVGLEQSTSAAVAAHKAKRFEERDEVVDWCCGIGSDTIALAAHSSVSAHDFNPAHCQMTEWNAAVHGVGERVRLVCGDVRRLDATDRVIHIDPDQRGANRKRSRRVEDCVPGLEFLQDLTRTARGGAIKLSPASNFAGKFDDCEIELVSLNGECKEAIVWFGELRGREEFRATTLPDGESISGHPLDALVDAGAIENFIYDPDPAIVRSGLVSVLCAKAGLKRLDDAEEYLTSDFAIETAFAQRFEVIATLPNNSKEIRRYFREHPTGEVEIKCRHIPVSADALRRRLSLTGTERRTLIIARVDGRAKAIVCQRC